LLTDKLDSFALVEHLIAVLLDGGKMNKYILTTGPLDETKALGAVEPLDYSLLFQDLPPSSVSRARIVLASAC
jgi:hypothetical protein